ncbi:hypothetical protein [Streptomyces globisporus]|uniref:hypothetical protein n=1 Tax=Streptomyces globisporus TaxID=1908 RepID=UPI0011E01C3B|nr:hypothetical protein [Streptomyces globisporus]
MDSTHRARRLSSAGAVRGGRSAYPAIAHPGAGGARARRIEVDYEVEVTIDRAIVDGHIRGAEVDDYGRIWIDYV